MTDTVEPRWERLHPASFVLRSLETVPQALLGLVGASLAMRGSIVLITIAAATVALLIGFVSWSRFRFAVTDDALRIESGIVSRRRRIIPLDRVQDVDIERGPLHRLLGLARARVETGGADKNEGLLDGVVLARAIRLREELRGARTTTEAAIIDDAPLYRLGAPRLLLAGLFNFSLVYLAILFSALQILGPRWGLSIDELVEQGKLRASAESLASLGGVAIVLAVAVLLGIVTGVARTVLTQWNFALFERGRSLVRRRGLLTASEVAIAMSRVQAAHLTAGPLMRALRLEALAAQTLGGGGAKDDGGMQPLVLLGRREEIDAVLARAMPLTLPDTDAYRRGALSGLVPRILKATFAAALALALATPAIALAKIDDWTIPLAAIVPLAALLAWLGWRSHRWHLAARHVFIRRGWWRRRVGALPLDRAQAVIVRQGPIDRVFGLASVAIDSAGARRMAGFATPRLMRADAEHLALNLVALSRAAAR